MNNNNDNSNYEVGIVEVDDGTDWDYFLENLPEIDLIDNDLPLSIVGDDNPSPDSSVTCIADVEHLLMQEDNITDTNEVVPDQDFFWNEFLNEILVVDSPPPSLDHRQSDCNSDFVAVFDDNKNSDENKTSDENVSDGNGTPDQEEETVGSKKRQRQLKNKDAAVRSRERKKMYVKDLQLKSSYLEGECKRLGQMLHCCYAENQALRVQLLHKGSEASYGASVTKQESAVLFLESLLLGSLLWFLCTVCLFDLPKQPPETDQLESRENVLPVVLKEPGSRSSNTYALPVIINSRKCKASRTRMKPIFLCF